MMILLSRESSWIFILPIIKRYQSILGEILTCVNLQKIGRYKYEV